MGTQLVQFHYCQQIIYCFITLQALTIDITGSTCVITHIIVKLLRKLFIV